MHKKTVEKKKHYRRINKRLKNFSIHNDGWYNHYHIHLDWSGYSNRSKELRQRHIQYYLELLDESEKQIIDNSKFQIWIYISDENGANDALYIHTENPHSEFPCQFSGFEWIDKLPDHYQELDKDKYKIGMLNFNGVCYIIQKKGVGISL